jgi:hypothetical protein
LPEPFTPALAPERSAGASVVLERFKPLYNFDLRETLSPKAQTLLDLLATSCQPLPGCTKPGLLESQKHLAVALRRVQRKYGFAILNGEQGSGKTKSASQSRRWPKSKVVRAFR